MISPLPKPSRTFHAVCAYWLMSCDGSNAEREVHHARSMTTSTAHSAAALRLPFRLRPRPLLIAPYPIRMEFTSIPQSGNGVYSERSVESLPSSTLLRGSLRCSAVVCANSIQPAALSSATQRVRRLICPLSPRKALPLIFNYPITKFTQLPNSSQSPVRGIDKTAFSTLRIFVFCEDFHLFLLTPSPCFSSCPPLLCDLLWSLFRAERGIPTIFHAASR